MKSGISLLIACILVSVLVVGCTAKPAETPSTTTTASAPTPSPPPPKPVEFVISNLTITPNEVNSGASVTIEVTVTNIGELSGTYEVNLKINDTIEGAEKVTLAGGVSQKITFIKSKFAAETYSVSIGDLSGTFVVKSVPPPTPTTPTPPTPSATPVSTWTEWGPASFGSEYPATPGTTVNFVKVGEGTSPEGKPTINFSLAGVGLSKDKVYYLWSKGLRQSAPTQYPLEMSIGDGGYVVPKGSSAPMSLGLHSYAKGEALTVALMTADKSIIAFGKVILYPIEAKQGSRRIWVELIGATGNSFVIYGEGFEPNEELETTSASDGEVVKYKTKVNGNGQFVTMLLPAVVGKQSGLATFTVVGKAGTLTVSFEWGPPALRSGP